MSKKGYSATPEANAAPVLVVSGHEVRMNDDDDAFGVYRATVDLIKC